MYIFISNFRLINPIFCMFFQELSKIMLKIRIINNSLNKTIIIFLP